MSELHLHETELACVTSGEAGAPADANASAPANASVAEHLRWCAQCRSTAAEYRWLGERIEDVLTEAAGTVNVPRPKWQAIRRQMAVGQNRQVTGWRASAIAGIALAICAILSLSSIVGSTAIAQTSSPEAVMTPASVTAILSDAYTPSGATPTPGVSCAGMESLSALTLPTIPTPPEPDV
jgi:predicted anti-sigma-YlaC factor YlaD